MVCKPTLFVKEVEFAGHVVGHGQDWEAGVPAPLGEARNHHRTPVLHGVLQPYSGYVRMYAELSGPLDAASGQVRPGRGARRSLPGPLRPKSFNRLKERLLAVGAIPRGPGQGIRATDGRLRLCCRGSSRADPGRGRTYPWVLEAAKYGDVPLSVRSVVWIGLQPVVVSPCSWPVASGPAVWHETFAKFDSASYTSQGRTPDCLYGHRLEFQPWGACGARRMEV